MPHQRDGYRFLIENASKWAGSLWWVQTALRKMPRRKKDRKIPEDQKNSSAYTLPDQRERWSMIWVERTRTHRNPVLVLLRWAPFPTHTHAHFGLLFLKSPHHVSKHRVTQRKHHCRNQVEPLVNNPVSKTPARASFSHSLPKWVGGLSSDIKSPQQLKTKACRGFAELRQNHKINWAESRRLLGVWGFKPRKNWRINAFSFWQQKNAFGLRALALLWNATVKSQLCLGCGGMTRDPLISSPFFSLLAWLLLFCKIRVDKRKRRFLWRAWESPSVCILALSHRPSSPAISTSVYLAPSLRVYSPCKWETPPLSVI